MIYTILNDAMLLLAKKPMTAEGDEVCNNTFRFHGECQWMPEKGFVDRK